MGVLILRRIIVNDRTRSPRNGSWMPAISRARFGAVGARL